MSATDAAIVVLMTAANGEEAVRLADLLIGAHLAACVQIMPEWNRSFAGRERRAPAGGLRYSLKTTRSRFEELEREVRALHSYDTPEIIALPIVASSTPYLEWLSANVKP